jgi:diguanylate cyclase (GGDEF)-like protein
MSMSKKPPQDIAVTALTEVINKSVHIQDQMEEWVDDLSSANIALKMQLGGDYGSIGVRGAIEKSESVENKVREAVDKLSDMNRALQGELQIRQLLEQRLFLMEADRENALTTASYDALTGLPNRMLFNERLKHGIAQAKRHDWLLAVMFVDLDNFKMVNDSYGHDLGDFALKAIAERLKTAMRDEDIVCRHGGDEFLYLFTDMHQKSEIEAIAKKIIMSIEKPIEIDANLSTSFPILSASIGIAIYPKDGTDVNALIKSADVAMYVAKRSRTRYAFAE